MNSSSLTQSLPYQRKTSSRWFFSYFEHIDWIMFGATLPLVAAGLITMNSFIGENYFFSRQLMWAIIAIAVFFGASFVDWRFLKRSSVLLMLYGGAIALLLALFVLGTISNGAQSWFRFGSFGFQPSDPVKLLVILILAKYFSRRHIEIAHFRHIIVSGIYAFVPALLVLLQPDFGSAIIVGALWLGMIVASGVSKKHLVFVIVTAAVAFSGLWFFVFEDYQKDRIRTFINPLTDISGAGYNAYQSTVAVGSGEVFGKGVGYGTQSRLKFLPEYQTDFIFAAFAEEWGFIGAIILFLLYGIVIWRVLHNAMLGSTNMETLFGVGVAILFISHFTIHVGMNIGLLPITGITVPFLSYGGSHLVTEFLGLGMLMGMRKYSRAVHRDDMKNEFVGI